METNNMILVERFCTTCKVEDTFINALHEHGLIELIIMEDKKYIAENQVKRLESALTFHDELNINLEGIDVIFNLLNQIDNLQQELLKTKNKLSLFDAE